MVEAEFSLLDHPMTVKAKLRRMVREGRLKKEEAERIYLEWLKKSKGRLERRGE